MAKAIIPERYFWSSELLSVDGDRWNGLKKHIPQNLTAETDALLRSQVLECCSWFMTENRRFRESLQTFAAMPSRGKDGPAALERLMKGLRMAANAWTKIKEKPFHDDRVTDISRFDVLDDLAADAERRFAVLRALEPTNASSPFGEFVRRLAKCCRAAGLEPGVTGRLYDDRDAQPTWFQKFIIALNSDLLGNEGPWPNNVSASNEAKAAAIVLAMRGDKKPVKTRK